MTQEQKKEADIQAMESTLIEKYEANIVKYKAEINRLQAVKDEMLEIKEKSHGYIDGHDNAISNVYSSIARNESLVKKTEAKITNVRKTAERKVWWSNFLDGFTSPNTDLDDLGLNTL